MHPLKEKTRWRWISTHEIVFQIECKNHVLCWGARIFLVQKEMSKSHLMTARENTWNDERRLFSLLHTGYIHFNRTCTFSYLQANDSFSNFFYFDNTCVDVQELFNYTLDMRVLSFIHLIRLLKYDNI